MLPFTRSATRVEAWAGDFKLNGRLTKRRLEKINTLRQSCLDKNSDVPHGEIVRTSIVRRGISGTILLTTDGTLTIDRNDGSSDSFQSLTITDSVRFAPRYTSGSDSYGNTESTTVDPTNPVHKIFVRFCLRHASDALTQ